MLVTGSATSPDSRRLAGASEGGSCRAKLIDDEHGLDPGRPAGIGSIGVAAGASAPNEPAKRAVAALASLGPVEVRERVLIDESVQFALPGGLCDTAATEASRSDPEKHMLLHMLLR